MSEREQVPCGLRPDLDCNQECELYKTVKSEWELEARRNSLDLPEYVNVVRAAFPLMSVSLRNVYAERRIEDLKAIGKDITTCYNLRNNITH